MAGLTAFVLAIHSTGFAQTDEEKSGKAKKFGDNDEIVIKPKADVDVKLNVEITKDGQIIVNGKPVDEFNDDNVSVRKKKIMIMDGRTLDMAKMGADDMMGRQAPFMRRGGWSINGADSNRAFLGVSSVRADENTEGAKVKEVTKGSAAEKAGLKEGDLITRVDEIAISDPQDLGEAIHKYKSGDKITLTYKREGKEEKTTITLGKFSGAEEFKYNYNFRVPPMPPMAPMPPYGDGPGVFSFNDGRPKLGIKAQDLDEGKGARVLDVDDDSPADKAGIKEGDIITKFDGKDVDNATVLADLAHDLKGRSSIKIGLTRDGKSRDIDVKVPRKLKTADL